MYRREQVVVLRREGFSRTSLRLGVWGAASGLVTLTARGIMRPGNNRLGDMACEYDVADVVFFMRSGALSGILVDYAVQTAFPNHLDEMPGSARRFGEPGGWFAALSAVREAVFHLWEGYPTETADAAAVFHILGRFLRSAGRVQPVWAAVACVMNLLRVAGLQPDLGSCALCDRALDGAAFFSGRQQGFLCPSCAGRDRPIGHDGGAESELLRLDAGLIRVLQRLTDQGVAGAEGLATVRADRVLAVMRLLEDWFRVTIGREPRSLRMLVPGKVRSAV